MTQEEKILLNLEMLKHGLVPTFVNEKPRSVTESSQGMSPEDLRICKRKFRKLFRKILKKGPKPDKYGQPMSLKMTTATETMKNAEAEIRYWQTVRAVSVSHYLLEKVREASHES